MMNNKINVIHIIIFLEYNSIVYYSFVSQFTSELYFVELDW